jgi:chorismate mutase
MNLVEKLLNTVCDQAIVEPRDAQSLAASAPECVFCHFGAKLQRITFLYRDDIIKRRVE